MFQADFLAGPWASLVTIETITVFSVYLRRIEVRCQHISPATHQEISGESCAPGRVI